MVKVKGGYCWRGAPHIELSSLDKDRRDDGVVGVRSDADGSVDPFKQGH
jgi:hypothetical protein